VSIFLPDSKGSGIKPGTVQSSFQTRKEAASNRGRFKVLVAVGLTVALAYPIILANQAVAEAIFG